MPSGQYNANSVIKQSHSSTQILELNFLMAFCSGTSIELVIMNEDMNV